MPSTSRRQHLQDSSAFYRLANIVAWSCGLPFVPVPILVSGVEVAVHSSGAMQSGQLMRSESPATIGGGRHVQPRGDGRDAARRPGDGPARVQKATMVVSSAGVSPEARPLWNLTDSGRAPFPMLFALGSSASSAGPTLHDHEIGVEKLIRVDPERHRRSFHIHRGTANSSGEADLDLDMLRLAEGVGTMTYDKSAMGNRLLNRELRRRLSVQDAATIALLLVAFAFTILISCLTVYHVSEDPSPVLFYSDPRHLRQRLVCASAEPDAFVSAFCTQPQTARLRIVGKNSEDRNILRLLRQGQYRELRQRLHLRLNDALLHSVFRVGRAESLVSHRRPWDPVVFDVALDLTPFIAGDGRLRSEADAAALDQHLRTSNPLQILALTKTVEWVSWEDVATNVRHHLRTLGFSGKVDVKFEATEVMLVYRNDKWQNFVRNRITHFLVVLSVVGGLFWMPYLWVRKRTVKVEARFQINLDLARYWQLLAEGLHASEGFHG